MSTSDRAQKLPIVIPKLSIRRSSAFTLMLNEMGGFVSFATSDAYSLTFRVIVVRLAAVGGF
ncbi:hypothetical protein [Trichothermofontia sp.]